MNKQLECHIKTLEMWIYNIIDHNILWKLKQANTEAIERLEMKRELMKKIDK